MCLTNDQKMTDEFPEEMKVYKILERDTNQSPCMLFKYKNGWNEAEILKELYAHETNYGFHVLLDKEEAEELRAKWTWDCRGDKFFTVHETTAYKKDLIAAGYFHAIPGRYKSAAFKRLYLELEEK